MTTPAKPTVSARTCAIASSTDGMLSSPRTRRVMSISACSRRIALMSSVGTGRVIGTSARGYSRLAGSTTPFRGVASDPPAGRDVGSAPVSDALLEGPPLRLPDPCLVVLVGATAAGKSQWAQQWFHPDYIVSSDRLRAVVGPGERDVRASRDAFEVLDLIVAKRLRRRLVTVVDSTGLERGRRDAWRTPAARQGVPAP